MTPSERLSKKIVKLLLKKKKFITTVESCTGGAIANFITDTSGSSDVIANAFVTYRDEGKIKLGVPKKLIKKYTPYSRQVVVAMARAGLARAARADISIGVTGVFHVRDLYYPDVRVGEVHIAVCTKTKILYEKHFLSRKLSRQTCKRAVIIKSIRLCLQLLV